MKLISWNIDSLNAALTSVKYIVYNQLVDNAVVAFFQFSGRERVGFQRAFSSVNRN